MQFEVGQIVGDYEVVGILGAGGMGAVYRVRNLISDRVEAMKVLLPERGDDSSFAERFLREIKIQASLSHPNIASLFAATWVQNQLLMFMEFVEGTTLETRLRQGRVDVWQGVDYVRQVLSALVYAHSHGVVHRDIKPANIIVTPEGQVKLTDFGIASTSVDTRLTMHGRIIGSLAYMAPEQIQGGAPDPLWDVYAMGIVLYETITGRRPFDAETDYGMMAAHIHQPVVPPVEIDPNVPQALSRVAIAALAKNPHDRIATAREFVASLDAARAGVTRNLPPSAVSGAFDPAVLDRVRKELAIYIGPMARIFVERMTKRARSMDELYRMLAEEIPSEADRRKFMSSRPK
ncbi:MAG TPA: serine/threonine-protein kinase [Bryobacteraceae bacterium]|nr:serine/threonine-protein kinase [Bryobacteraceae bacterium]